MNTLQSNEKKGRIIKRWSLRRAKGIFVSNKLFQAWNILQCFLPEKAIPGSALHKIKNYLVLDCSAKFL